VKSYTSKKTKIVVIGHPVRPTPESVNVFIILYEGGKRTAMTANGEIFKRVDVERGGQNFFHGHFGIGSITLKIREMVLVIQNTQKFQEILFGIDQERGSQSGVIIDRPVKKGKVGRFFVL
jgi:hypothetical protein